MHPATLTPGPWKYLPCVCLPEAGSNCLLCTGRNAIILAADARVIQSTVLILRCWHATMSCRDELRAARPHFGSCQEKASCMGRSSSRTPRELPEPATHDQNGLQGRSLCWRDSAPPKHAPSQPNPRSQLQQTEVVRCALRIHPAQTSSCMRATAYLKGRPRPPRLSDATPSARVSSRRGTAPPLSSNIARRELTTKPRVATALGSTTDSVENTPAQIMNRNHASTTRKSSAMPIRDCSVGRKHYDLACSVQTGVLSHGRVPDREKSAKQLRNSMVRSHLM